jgi:hypothetical protein
MTFYRQMDSINDDIVVADAGLVYVFVCFSDSSAQAVVQSGALRHTG